MRSDKWRNAVRWCFSVICIFMCVLSSDYSCEIDIMIMMNPKSTRWQYLVCRFYLPR